MPRPKKTTAQLESTREQILDTALAILQESGPEAITSRAIAERMGVAHMSLYTYFENQAAILRALSKREMAKWQAQQQVFDQRAETEDIIRVVEDLLKFFIRFARENPNLYRMAWVMPEVGGETPAENRQRMQATVGQLAALLQKGMESGTFQPRNPSLAAGTVLAMVNTPYILFHSGKMVDPTLRDQMVEEVLSAALGYLEKK
jgi:AcrR family transcriptional regulator